jgi:hypothetical protein
MNNGRDVNSKQKEVGIISAKPAKGENEVFWSMHVTKPSPNCDGLCAGNHHH